MAPLDPIYRLTLFAPGSETTVLTAAASAPNAGAEFKVATETGISGFEPYMQMPSGRKTSIKLLDSTFIVGTTRVDIGDAKLNDSVLQRFVTGFVGDEEGKTRLIGLKVVIEESVDGGSTFLPHYIGRVFEFELQDITLFSLRLKEDNDLLNKIKVFEGEPSASLFDHDNGGYANRRQCLPLGPNIGYGPVPILGSARGKWISAKSSRNRAIKVRKRSEFNAEPGRIWISKPLLDAVETDNDDAWKRETEGRRGPVVVRVTQGATVGRFFVTYQKLFFRGLGSIQGGQPFSVHSMLLEALDSNAFEYQPLTAFADDSNIEFQVLFINEPSEDFPMLLNYVKPVQLFKDILKGNFSPLDPQTGEAIFADTITVDDDAFDTLIADGRFKDSRWYVKKPEKMGKWLQENILKPYQLAYRMEPTSSGGVFSNKLVPFSLRLPTTLAGIQTITEADLDENTPVTWEPAAPFMQFETIYYSEQFANIQNLSVGAEDSNPVEGPVNPTLVSERAVSHLTVDLANVHSNGANYKTNARGVRYFPVESYKDAEYTREVRIFGISIDIGWPRQKVMNRLVLELHDNAVHRWSRGPATVTITAKRVAATTDLKIGEFRLLHIDILPDPFSHTRGTARLMQCTERSEITDSPLVKFTFVDSGVNIQRAAPTVDAFAQIGATNTASGSVSVLKAGLVQTSFAVTSQDQTIRPDETSSLWTFANSREFTISSSQDIVIGEFPGDSRVWVKAFARPDSTQDFELPSDFGFMSGDFFDVSTVLSPPSGLDVFNLTPSGASAAWTIGDTSASIEIRMKQDDEADFSNFTTLAPGMTGFAFTGRSVAPAANPHKIGVRHRDVGTGTISAEVTASYDITSVPITIQAPMPNRIIIRNSTIGML